MDGHNPDHETFYMRGYHTGHSAGFESGRAKGILEGRQQVALEARIAAILETFGMDDGDHADRCAAQIRKELGL